MSSERKQKGEANYYTSLLLGGSFQSLQGRGTHTEPSRNHQIEEMDIRNQGDQDRICTTKYQQEEAALRDNSEVLQRVLKSLSTNICLCERKP